MLNIFETNLTDLHERVSRIAKKRKGSNIEVSHGIRFSSTRALWCTSNARIFDVERSARFGVEPEPEARTAVICDEKLPSGGTSRCAAGGQTTDPGKRAVVSHVQTGSRDRSSPRVPRRNSAPPVNDRVGSTKNLEDYLRPRSRRKTPVKLSESPILSPDTAQALENAEKLVKEAQKRIIEASYDIESSPEREKSTGSAREKETDDEDALYIRDIVSMRFHEANESARIFTRPSTRPLAEHLYRPEARRRRARRLGEGINKIGREEPTTSRSEPSKTTSRTIERNLNPTKAQNSIRPQRVTPDEEIPSRIPEAKASSNSVHRSTREIANENAVHSFKVQEGPRVDIRNELTMTNVENVDISPRSRSSLPVRRNIKTYEFRHQSCVKDIVVDASRNSGEARSIDLAIGITSPARCSPEVTEKSRDPLRKSPGTGSASPRQGSRSDLVGNKSSRSIQPEPLEGHVDKATTIISKGGERVTEENEENRGESFIDYLRRSAASSAPNCGEDNKTAEALKDKVFRSLNTKAKIDIFDRAVDKFFDEFRRGEREEPVKISPRTCPQQGQEYDPPERDVVDGKLIEDRAGDKKSYNLTKEAFEDESEVFVENWDPEDINLEAPNLGDLEKTVRKFDGTIDKVVRGTRSLAVLMSQYSIEAEVPNRPEMGLTNQEPPSNDPTSLYSVPTEDMPGGQEQKKIDIARGRKIPTKYEDYKTPINRDGDFTGSSEYSKEISAPSRCKASREAKMRESEKNLPLKLTDPHPRFSTPLNNGSKMGSSYRSNADFKTNEFSRFLFGLQRPKGTFETQQGAVTDETNVSAVEKKNELLPALDIERQKKIVLDEIDRNCNFDTLFYRDRQSNTENEEKTHETVTFPTYTAREKRDSSDLRNSGTRSLIQDSAIGGTTDQSERISVGTKLTDVRVTRKDSSRSERSAPARKNDELSTEESPSAKTLTVKNNSIEAAEVVEVAIQDERELTEHVESKRENSANGEEISEKNRLAVSAGSSPRDRTSFDVSTVYSDDFEVPIVSSEKSKSQEKRESTKNDVSKSISKEKELSAKVEDTNREEEGKTVRSPSPKSTESPKLHSESKGEAKYLEKSFSVSVNESSDKNEDDKKDPILEGKGSVENNSERKEADPRLREVSEKSSKDRFGIVSSSASIKASGTSSLVGESHRAGIKRPKESNEVEAPGGSVLGQKLMACSCLLCEGVLGRCNCKACTRCLVSETNDEKSLEKSSPISAIESVTNDSLEHDEEDVIERGISEPVIEALETNSLDEVFTASCKLCSTETEKRSSKRSEKYSTINVELVQREDSVQKGDIEDLKKVEEKEELEKLDPQELSRISKIVSLTNDTNKSCQSFCQYSRETNPESRTNLERIANFESSVMIHSTPKEFISNSIRAIGSLVVPFPDPIPDDDHIEGAADTCSENYSEGELYLPSSCSYSLGEIRISERPSYGTVGAGIESSTRNADGIRIFFSKSYATFSSSDNAIDAPNTPAQSPGEVQETDVESICSSRILSSNGEHRQGS